MNGAAPPRSARAPLVRDLAVMVVIGLVLGIAGPFGMFGEPLWRRIVEWLVFALGGYLFFRPVVAAGHALAANASLSRLLTTALGCALAALPTTLLVAVTLAGWRFPLVSMGSLLGLYPQVLLMGIAVTAILALIDRARIGTGGARPAEIAQPVPAAPDRIAAPPPADPVSPAGKPTAPGGAFLDRLPPAIGRDLLCVENEDHYVRAHTTTGSGLILMRLRDAAAELEGVDGARVHRGWWVARTAVAEVIRRDRAIALRLVNGLEIPVARNEVPALRAAGWL